MARSVSGHEVLRPGDPRLATGTIPGTKRRLTLHRTALPLFLNAFAALSAEVKPLSWDTWSYAYRPARAAAAWSDHAAGLAADAWSGSIGAQVWPARMTQAQAGRMLAVLRRYKTADGRRILGWGARAELGGDYHRINDPMHVYVRPGIGVADLVECQHRMGIRGDGTSRAAA